MQPLKIEPIQMELVLRLKDRFAVILSLCISSLLGFTLRVGPPWLIPSVAAGMPPRSPNALQEVFKDRRDFQLFQRDEVVVLNLSLAYSFNISTISKKRLISRVQI